MRSFHDTSSGPPAPAAPRRDIHLILFHGLASSPKEFGLLVQPLRRQGVRLHTPAVRGFCAGQLDTWPSWEDWVEEAEACARAIVAENPNDVFVLGGLCTGAMLALAVSERRRVARVGGLALLSPLFAYDGWGLPWWYRLRRIAYATGITDFFSMKEREPFGLKNERMRRLVRQQLNEGEATVVGPASVPLACVRESERLSRHVMQLLPGLQLPMLVQHAREDEICSLASVRRALALVRNARVRLEVIEDSYHMITADNQRATVASQLADFAIALGGLPIQDLSTGVDDALHVVMSRIRQFASVS